MIILRSSATDGEFGHDVDIVRDAVLFRFDMRGTDIGGATALLGEGCQRFVLRRGWMGVGRKVGLCS